MTSALASTDPADVLRRYLAQARDALLWKLDGLGERDLRRPLTPTGTSLLGIVKHCANVELGYFGPTFDRLWPHGDNASFVPLEAYDDDPQADWWVPAEVPAADVLAFYRQVADFADATLREVALDTPGTVAWWPVERATVSLHRIAVHVIEDVSRHAGQADILRESIDGAVGMVDGNTNVPDDYDWPAYRARLKMIADSFPV